MDRQDLHKAELIDRFLHGEMDETEQKAFEYQLSQDAELREELESTDIARQGIRHLGLRAEVKQIREQILKDASVPSLEDHLQSEVKTLPLYAYAYRVAAGLLILLLAGLVLQTAVVSPEGLYNSKMELSSVNDVTRGRGETPSQTAMLDAYQQNRFEDALQIYAGIAEPSVVEHFFAAAAHLQLEQFEEAIGQYQQILEMEGKTDNQFLLQEASYKLALTQLRVEAYDQAIVILEDLDNNHPYYDKLISNSFMWKLKLLRFKDQLF
ncbi:hypothetical protein PZB74_14860 [Porifericola rhodea]|uniref:tetratricopeptide repeat protein n=1 Tax=Porifericola rhodea TaxID=930972 RepID=UPI002665A529|nr:hypothetical protein [Porifericola rhodea]WKN30244.1 hypothetical protein PZB74_14860 [Porifericola rhodea]